MRVFLDAAHGNERDALALYSWHSELVSAVHVVLGDAQVVLRNAIDRELKTWNEAQTGDQASWLLTEPAAPLRSLTAAKRKEALRRLGKLSSSRVAHSSRERIVISHDDVVAQLPFGVWKELLPNHQPGPGNSYQNLNRLRMWKEALVHAFPHVVDVDGRETYWRVSRLHHLRNRVSHMEPLLRVDIPDRMHDAFVLVRSIDTDAGNWITGMNRVPEVLARKPRFADYPTKAV